MDYVMPTLLCEGSTDARFLPRLLQRVLEDVLFAQAVRDFELADVFELGDTAGLVEPAICVSTLYERDAYAFNVVFVHRDSDARDDSKSLPWCIAVKETLRDAEVAATVFVVPIRMSEAWMLCDGDALRSAMGVTWTDSELGVPGSPADVERIAEPKSALNAVNRRLRGPNIDLYSRVGERVSLDRLRHVPSFIRMEQELLSVLRNKGVVA